MSKAAIRQLHLQLNSLSLKQEEVRERTNYIYQALLDGSQYLEDGNFETIHVGDLQLLFDLYDREFFDGHLSAAARCNNQELTFRLSNRMTRAGGTTTRLQHRQAKTKKILRLSHEIAISTTLLFQTFHDLDHRSITVTGVICEDRVQALQRVFEHELVHLMELLIWDDSSCSAARFAGLAGKLFAHTEMTHQLITPRERAYEKYGIRTGDQVAFELEGKRYVGFVNRITKRATVLVEDPLGQEYSNGKCYLKFYVPVQLLKRV